MKNLLVLLSLILSNLLFCQDSLSVLFIGNSYTYVNDLPGTLNSLTLSLGDKITYDSQTAGGATFQVQTNTPAVFTKIKSKQWDFVVLQAQSQEPSFPTSQVNTGTIPYAIQLADSIYVNKFCSQIMMYMTWGRQNGDPQWDSISTFNGMNGRLRDAYLRIMDSVQGSMSPVGSAWRYVRDNYPSINLYSSDGSHPSTEGTYLAACTFYASLFRKSPVGASFNSTIGQTNASILQNVAALTVLDSLGLWNLHDLSELTISDFVVNQNNESVALLNQSLKADQFSWNFGDGTSESIEENPTHTFTSNGTYTITLIASSSCDSDMFSIDVNVNNLSDNALVSTLGSINYKILCLLDNQYQIQFFSSENIHIQLYDVNSKLQMSKSLLTNEFNIDLSNLENGIYILNIETDKFKKTERLLKSK